MLLLLYDLQKEQVSSFDCLVVLVALLNLKLKNQFEFWLTIYILNFQYRGIVYNFLKSVYKIFVITIKNPDTVFFQKFS